MIIAIDGPAASGKGTLARKIAAALGLPHLDTGLLYRGTARALLDGDGALQDTAAATAAARSLDPASFDERRLRTKEMGEAASLIAAIPEVRAALVALQRSFAQQQGGAVLDGRDIGTVICPEADVKIFVVASVEVRAGRRHHELQQRGEAIDEATVLADIKERDRRDSSRQAAPLRPAPDAVVLDTTALDVEAAFEAAFAIVQAQRTIEAQQCHAEARGRVAS